MSMRRSKVKSRTNAIVQTILFFSVSALLLTLMHRDIQQGLKMFKPPGLAQTSIDDEMQKIHLAPIFGGHDLTPPHRLATLNGKVSLEPIMGSHQYDGDAVFAIGNTLDYEETLLFITTLRRSGFEGDIVLSTIDKSAMERELVELLEYHCQEGGKVIVYDGVIRVEGTDENFSKAKNVTTDYVYLRGLYQDIDTGDNLDDARIPRTLGVARFELYWAWSTKYSPSSTILLIDAEDTYFQEDAFYGIGVGKSCTYPIINNRTEFDATIHIYEENQKNMKHRLNTIKNKTQLVEAYKNRVVLIFAANENVLTPASTHGHQRAIEAYLRAMIKQFDYTQCAKYWCEWAFHNYLYYLGVLGSLPEIVKIKPHMQGTGAVNSIGKDAPLNTSDIFDAENCVVMNKPMGRGHTPSWAVHQYKSDEQLYHFVNSTKKKLVSELDFSKHPFQHLKSIDLKHKNSLIMGKPICGHHRKTVDAIFSLISGDDLNQAALFILSARNKGFTGDFVIHTPKLSTLSPEVASFLKKQCEHGVVIYEGHLERKGNSKWILDHFYSNMTGETIPDTRPARPTSSARLEIFNAWIDNYETGSSILITEGEETIFQSNPFELSERNCESFELSVFQEDLSVASFGGKEHRKAFATMFNNEEMDVKFQETAIVNPAVLIGHKYILKELIVQMINTMEEFGCVTFHGCDWAAINLIWTKKTLPREFLISYEVENYKFANGKVLLPLQFLKQMKNKKIFDGKKKVFLSKEEKTISVVLRYNQITGLKEHYDSMTKELLASYEMNTAED